MKKKFNKIREFYGFSQQYLSGYLKVPRSNLAMYETGKRPLPADAQVKLSQLNLAMIDSENKYNDERLNKIIISHNEKKNEFINDRLKYHDTMVNRLSRKLSEMKANQVKSIKALKSIASLLANSSGKEKTYLEIIEFQALQLYEKSGEYTQLMLELKIRVLEAEFEYIKKIK